MGEVEERSNIKSSIMCSHYLVYSWAGKLTAMGIETNHWRGNQNIKVNYVG